MELYVPCTIDLRKHQTSDKRYGLEHINKLLEEELSQLRALKNQNPKELVFPTVKNRNEKNTAVEALKDYQRRVEQVRSRGCRVGPEEKPLEHKTSNITPFSELSHDFPKDKRVIGKGEMPFFQLSQSDGRSLSRRLPRLLETRTGRNGNSIKGLPDEALDDNHRLNSKRSERGKHLSGRLVRSSVRTKQDLSTDTSTHEELTNSLRIQYCNMTVRDSIELETRKKSRGTLTRNDQNENKTFYLACTREPVKYRAVERDEDDCTFCAGSVFHHSHRPQNGAEKSQRMRERKAKTSEKTFLPRLERQISEKTKMIREPCEKCRKRSVQAEQNRIALATASSSRKHELKNVIERKAKSRTVTKEQTNPPLPPDKKEIVLPLLEYTAYMDQDGFLFLLPGAFTLRKKDYNIWSRKRQSSEGKAISSQTIMTGTSLPNLVN